MLAWFPLKRSENIMASLILHFPHAAYAWCDHTTNINVIHRGCFRVGYCTLQLVMARRGVVVRFCCYTGCECSLSKSSSWNSNQCSTHQQRHEPYLTADFDMRVVLESITSWSPRSSGTTLCKEDLWHSCNMCDFLFFLWFLCFYLNVTDSLGTERASTHRTT